MSDPGEAFGPDPGLAPAERVRQLRETIRRHSETYYNDPAGSEIPDADYDNLVDELRLLESEHPELERKTRRPFSSGRPRPASSHRLPMRSR